MGSGCRPVWVDGRLLDPAAAALRADDGAYAEGRGCFTTARAVAGKPRRVERHVRRLCRDARQLGLEGVDAGLARRALEELCAAAFGDGDGIVRLQVSRAGDGRLHLVAVPRPLEPDKHVWTAVRSDVVHPGPRPYGGAKVSARLDQALARDAARAAGADEALLLDAGGRLIEGATSNLFAAGPDGGLATPDLARGGVAGIARELVLERVPGIHVRDVREGEPLRELIAVNAVRGAVPIVRVDGRDVGDGRPGPWAARLTAALERD